MNKLVGKKILVILPNNLGDVIMATPVLQGLKAESPDARISFFVEQGFEAGIEKNPHCDEIIRFPRKAIRDGLWFGDGQEGFGRLLELVAQLNAVGFDTVVNLSQHPYLSYLAAAIKAKTCCGQCFLTAGNHAIMDCWSQYLYAIAFSRRYNRLHATDVYRRIAGVMRHNGNTLSIDGAEKQRAADYLSSKGFDPHFDRIAVFQPSAALAAKRWPPEHFIRLGNLLCQSGWRILISGAPSEAELAHTIAGQIIGTVRVAAGETSFREAMANLSFAKACVTGDTALMHAAAALHVPVYALFGSTNPVETGPYGDGHWVFSAGCNDRPCFCKSCKSMLCMKSILPETVYACIERGDPGPQTRCVINRTALKADGDYRLIPSTTRNFEYSTAGSALTQAAFEMRTSALDAAERIALQADLVETELFITRIDEMRRLLELFLQSRDAAAITVFEQKKAALSSFAGIGAFWTAVLNLRLNSVPLIDPAAGVHLSAAVCRDTISQLAVCLAL
jgi:ADP-heptose:LPS heptosyltransferase